MTELRCRVPGCPNRRVWDTQDARRKHEDSHKRPWLMCPHCGLRRKTQRVLDRHIAAQHPETLQTDEELVFETEDHWQEFEATKAENEHLKAEVARLDALRKRYYDNWQKAKKSKR